jgi:hypothetical protein
MFANIFGKKPSEPVKKADVKLAHIFKFGTSAGSNKAWAERNSNALPDEKTNPKNASKVKTVRAKDVIDKAKELSKQGVIGPKLVMADYNKKFADERAVGTDDKTPESKAKLKSLEDDIMGKLNPEDANEIRAKIVRAKGEPSSKDAYTDKNGEYTKMSTHIDPLTGKMVTEPRVELHKKIIQKYINEQSLADAKPADGTDPTFIVLGGRGGSGKSSFTNGRIKEFDAKNFIKLDSDEIKGLLRPPYEGWNAFTVHDESSDLFDAMTNVLKANRVNFIHDITMKSLNVKRVIDAAKSEGYDTQGHYMYVPPQTSALRAQERYLGRADPETGKTDPSKRGRLVPAFVLLQDMQHNEQVFDTLKSSFSNWTAWDNQGDEPVLLGRKA